MYLGTETGTMHIAAALNKPIVMLNREAVHSTKTFLSMCLRFYPWQSPYIVLQPQNALKPCCDHISPVGCIANQPHCITQIKPKDIAAAFEKLKDVTYLSKSN